MASQLLHKRKQYLRLKSTSPSSISTFSSSKWYTLLLFFFFSFFFLFESSFPSIGSKVFRPVLIVSQFSPLLVKGSSSNSESLFPLKVEERVLFPDHVLLLVSKSDQSLLNLYGNNELDCVYRIEEEKISNLRNWVFLPVLSVDDYDELRSIARCPVPPANYSAFVSLQKRGRREELYEDDGFLIVDRLVHSWENLAYKAALDGDKAVVFVKGLNLRPDRASDPAQFSCHFGLGNSGKSSGYVLTTRAVTVAQEVVRCSLPLSLQRFPDKVHGVGVTIGVASHSHGSPRAALGGEADSSNLLVPSVAKLFHSNSEERNKKNYELCACTMVWNQASSLREWIVYHAWLGVERWFIYDNNSEDGIKDVIDELDRENYNVSRHIWPWIKTQEAGFSHCVLRARRDECKWVAFMDVDEFFYFPIPTSQHRTKRKLGYPGYHSLRTLVSNFSTSRTIGELRTACHSFGPSGLSGPPSQGVTVGYTCRLQSPERHKSIVRLDVLDETLLNVVHHFHLSRGYRYLNVPQSTALVNHYKYQVWEAFRAKFFRRVATYVADWQENHNEGSKDRAPGLGTEAIEPPNWRLQFCEVWDTGLRDFMIANLADPATGMLPWEGSLL